MAPQLANSSCCMGPARGSMAQAQTTLLLHVSRPPPRAQHSARGVEYAGPAAARRLARYHKRLLVPQRDPRD